ncbi:DUF3040 domain-containing protein [Luteococcus sp. Sow4_B9]|uniref:DUF3040 domain-containing protein n=1 Tax=Luteococcus sp. Sow4_B9 TaxID=3438792 RepID=UPI003F990474
MALSEQEQRLLDQLEASLTADDPALASTLRGETPQTPARPRRAGGLVLGFVVGLVGLVGGVQVHPVVSLLGFVVMLISAVMIADHTRPEGQLSPQHPAQRAQRRAAGLDLDQLDRAAEQWRKEGGR